MKKLYLLLYLATINMPLQALRAGASSFAAYGVIKASQSTSTHYIINLTGRTIIFNFYAKNPITKKTFWRASNTCGPLIIAGKSTTNVVDTLNYKLLPQPIDMHTNSSFKVTIDAFSLTDSKLKDKGIKGISMPTPPTSVTPNDIQISLDGDQLVVKLLPKCIGIKIAGATTKQWPTEEELATAKMNPEQKITALQQQNQKLQEDIAGLKSQISKLKKKGSKINKINNRKKTIANKQQLIEINKKTIAKLEEQIAAAKTAPDAQAKDEKPSNDSTESN